MSEQQPGDGQAESNDPEFEFMLKTPEGINAILKPSNTIIYRDEEHPEISCAIHSFEGSKEPLYFFGRRENIGPFLEALLDKGFKSYTLTDDELSEVGRQYITWLGTGYSYSEEGPVIIRDN